MQILQNYQSSAKFCNFFKNSAGEPCKSQKMLNNAYLLAKIGADTAANEQHFAETLPIGRRGPSGHDPVVDRVGSGGRPRRRRRACRRARTCRDGRPRRRAAPLEHAPR